MKRLFFMLAALTGFSVTAATILENEVISVYQEKQYKKIEISQVSKEAMDKIKKSYGSYTIKEAYKADDGEYKLVLTKDGIDTTATFTSTGNLIKILN